MKVSVTQDYNDILLKPYSKEEIFAALSNMSPCKSLRYDCMHAIFFIRDSSTLLVMRYLTLLVIFYITTVAHNVNCTNIALIPTIKFPIVVSKFSL